MIRPAEIVYCNTYLKNMYGRNQLFSRVMFSEATYKCPIGKVNLSISRCSIVYEIEGGVLSDEDRFNYAENMMTFDKFNISIKQGDEAQGKGGIDTDKLKVSAEIAKKETNERTISFKSNPYSIIPAGDPSRHLLSFEAVHVDSLKGRKFEGLIGTIISNNTFEINCSLVVDDFFTKYEGGNPIKGFILQQLVLMNLRKLMQNGSLHQETISSIQLLSES